MMQFLDLFMRWGGGKPKPISTTSDTTIYEVAEAHGFHEPDGFRAIFIANGKILAPQLSLQRNKINDSDVIYVYMKRLPVEKPELRPSPPLTREERWWQKNKHIAWQIQEFGRISDLAFASWETLPDFPKVLQKTLRIQEEMADAVRLDMYQGPPTVVKESKSISDEPLPCLLAM